MTTEPHICEYCVADNELRMEIRERGSRISKCKICLSKKVLALPAKDSLVKRIFKALVRLHYSEWDYNGHIGGDELESLMIDHKYIFNLPEKVDIMEFEQSFLILADDWYSNDPDDINLGGGYWDGGILRGVKSQMDSLVSNVLNESFKLNYFELEDNVIKLLKTIEEDISQELTIGSLYHRARVGIKSRLKRKALHFEEIFEYLPYSGRDILNPPINRANEGRLNRSRVSVLYLATDPETAIAELRPHPGHLVSTAEFELKKPIKIANFANHDIRKFLNDDRLEVLRRILSFSSVLNLPIQPEHHTLYLITQLFSDCIRKSGYDGVAYKSTLGNGLNLACFRPAVFEQKPNSESIFEVHSLQYGLVKRNVVKQDYEDRLYESHEEGVLETLFDGLTRKHSRI